MSNGTNPHEESTLVNTEVSSISNVRPPRSNQNSRSLHSNIHIHYLIRWFSALYLPRYDTKRQSAFGRVLGCIFKHSHANRATGLSKGATAGSFIRPNRTPDASRSFSEALKAKYAPDNVQDPSIHIVFATKPGDNALKKDPLARINQPIRISGKEVEEVGFDKIRKQLAQLSELRIVILDGLCMERSIARLKDGKEEWEKGLTDVREACPKVVELDLSRNLFEEWREVASICEQLEKLKSLRVEYAVHIMTTLTI